MLAGVPRVPPAEVSEFFDQVQQEQRERHRQQQQPKKALSVEHWRRPCAAVYNNIKIYPKFLLFLRCGWIFLLKSEVCFSKVNFKSDT